jgi:23S rRNA (cytidine1920-2'-O)/16S rRNA (cytidine1409-2'-O)-methyltransferase
MSRLGGATGRSRRERADLVAVEQGLAESRTRAQALILAGRLWLGETRIDKPGTLLLHDAPLRLAEGPRYVSRGGDKLAHALDTFAAEGLDVSGRTAVDIGASTGGFTDCLLQRGARRVHAVDVGHGQLHPKLRADSRVCVWERTNARSLQPEQLGEPIELVVVDASFIGIGKLIEAVARILPPGGELVALVKPQFEAGRSAAARGRGVIRDPAVRDAAIESARAAVTGAGFTIVAEVDSPLRGPKGNVERLIYARRASAPAGPRTVVGDRPAPVRGSGRLVP